MGRCNVFDVAWSNPLPLPIVIGMIVRRRSIQMSTKKGKAKPRCFGRLGDSDEYLLTRYGIKEGDCEKCSFEKACLAAY